MEDGANQSADARLGDAEPGEVLGRLRFGELRELRLDLGGDDDGLGSEVRLGVVPDLA